MAGADDAAGVLVLRREIAGETMWAVFNRGDKAWSGAIDAGKQNAQGVAEVFTASGDSSSVRVAHVGRRIRVTVPPRDAVVLLRTEAKLAADE